MSRDDAADIELGGHQMMRDCKLIIRLVLCIGGDQHPDTLLFGDGEPIIELFHFVLRFHGSDLERGIPPDESAGCLLEND